MSKTTKGVESVPADKAKTPSAPPESRRDMVDKEKAKRRSVSARRKRVKK